MPIAIKSFIHVLKGVVSAVEPRIALNVNYSDDRIDYAGLGISGNFMTRKEIDEIDSDLDLISAARNRAEVIRIILDNE